MSVVHHNLKEHHTTESYSIHTNLPTTSEAAVKWTAQFWNFTEPLSLACQILVLLLVLTMEGQLS